MIEILYNIVEGSIQRGLELSALILSIVNATILIWYFLRDKPKLVLNPVHPEIYQWWFRLPDRKYKGLSTRRFGFLIYPGIANKGLRKTTINEWRLELRLGNFKKEEFKPLNIPQPQLKIGDQEKYFNVLGQVGIFSDGKTEIDSGSSISGMVFYTYECYGHDSWNPKVQNNDTIKAKFRVKEVFGNSTMKKLTLRKKTIAEIEKFIPNFQDFLNSVDKLA